MPKPFTPAGSARTYQIPDRTTDPVEVEPWFEDAITSIDTHLTEIQNDSGLDPFFLMGA